MWFLSILLLVCAPDTLDDRRAALEQAVDAYTEPLALGWERETARIAWVDLNGDRRDDALVYLSGSNWCGSDGCTVLVFEAMDEIDAEEFGAYRPAAEIGPTSGPIRVVESGQIWADLVAHAKDGTLRRLRFDGESYPPSISSAPHMEDTPIGGTLLFTDAR